MTPNHPVRDDGERLEPDKARLRAAPDPHPVRLSGRCERIEIARVSSPRAHPRTPEIGTPWSLAGYATARAPLPLGMAPIGWNAAGLPNVLDCCVREPGGAVLLPEEIARIRPVVERVLGFALAHDPTLRDAYIYVTTDQRWIEAGQTHRIGGFHADGIQGVRYRTPLPVCYAGVVADRAPTVFAPQAFALAGLRVATDHLFRAMDAQVDRTRCLSARPHEIMLMSAYCVHASPVVPAEGMRTFVRVEVSHKRFDRQGNTPNPAISGDWVWVPRPIPEGLI